MGELETELNDVYSRPLDPTASDPRRQMPFDDIKQRFSFLRKLLAAEIESQPETTDELEEINQKFTQIEADFDTWNNSKGCIFDNPIDTLEICDDCTQAILHHDNEDNDGAVGLGSEAHKDFSAQQSPSPEKLLKMDERGIGERKVRKRGKYWKGLGLLKKDRRERGERKRMKKVEYWKAFGRGMIVGALIIWLMMEFYLSTENAAFLLPPT